MLQSELEPLLSKIYSEARTAWLKHLSDQRIELDDRDSPGVKKAENDFYGSIDDLIARFRRYYAFDAHDFQMNVDQLVTTGAERRPGEPLVSRPTGGTADGCLFSAQDNFIKPVVDMIDAEEWTGTAAKTFEEEFLKKFETASHWQRAYARVLAGAAAALQVGSNRSKRAIEFVAEGCLSALSGGRPVSKADLDFPDTSKDLPGKGVTESIGIIAGIVGFIPPLSIPAGIVGLASGLYSATKTGSTEPNLTIDHTGSPQQTVRLTGDAITNLEEWIAGEDGNLAQRLDADRQSGDAFGSPNLRSPKPGDAGGGFKRLTFLDDPASKGNAVVDSVAELGRAGYYHLPGAAYEYDQAAGIVERCQIPGSLSQFFPRSIAQFNPAADDLADMLRDTSESLRRAGEALLTAARNYETTDADKAKIIDDIDRGIPGPHHSIAPTK